MKKASITETKNQLSALIAAVKKGETILITERNRPVARLERVVAGDDDDDEARLVRLERSGIIRRPRAPLDLKLLKERPPRLPSGVSVLQALLDERSEDR